MTTYTVAYWLANQSTLDTGPSFTITDTAADISGAFDSLDLDTHITQLIISDNAAVTVTANQLFVSDTHAIGLLKNANNSAYTLVVSDTGANITTYLNNLQANTHVTTIVVASGVVDATVAQLASDSTALANLKTSVGGPQASITVSDTSAHLHSGWANVAADSQVSSIVISDNTQLTLTATQASQTSAVEKLVYANTTTSDIVLVKDTAAHIEADIGQLDLVASFVASVTVSDSTFETLSASQVSSYLAILEKIVFQSGPASFSVSDSSGQVSANLDALQALSGSISSIAVTDNSPITVSIAQLSNDSDALSLITYHSNPISVAVADTGSNISGNLATLEAAIQAESPPISSISVTSGVINTTVTQLNTDSAVFAALTGSYTLNVSDTASNISGALDTLQTFAHNGDISAINVTDSGNIAVTVAQITSDATAISELVDNDTNPYTLAVTDSAANIQAAFTSLGSNSHIASITFTGPSPVLTITASQFINGATVLGEITNGSFTIDVTGATAAQAATIATDFAGLPNEGSATLSIAVSDTAAHIDNNLVALGSNADVTSIAISDSNPLSLTEGQFTGAGHDAGLAKMTGTYTVDVTGVTVAQVPTVEGITGLGGTPTLSIAVSDAAANITGAALTSLGGDTKVTSIAVSDSNPITLTEAQFTNAGDDAGLDKMTGAYTVDISGATVAQVATVEALTGLGGTPTLSIAVRDVGASFTDSVLQSLGADNKVTSIAVSSGSVTLTEAQFTAAAEDAAFAKFGGSYEVEVSGVTVAQVATVEGISLPGTPDLLIFVSDSGANITDAVLQTLGADDKVGEISVSDSNPITLTEAQFTGGVDNAGLVKLVGTYTVDVTGAAVGDLFNVEHVSLGGSPTLSIAVSDTASNVGGALSTLGGDSKVTSIAVSDSNPITLTEAQFTLPGDDAGLAKMTGSYTVDVTGATVAQVATVEAVTLGGTPTLSIAVSDAGGSFTNSALQTLGADNDVTSIAVTSGIVSLNVTPFINAADDAGFAKFVGTYTVQVLGASVAQVATVEGVSLPGTPTLQIWVSDSGTNLTDSALQTLGADSKVTLILVSDSNPITLTEAQFTGTPEGTGLAKLSGFYTVDVTGATVAQVSTVEAVPLPGSSTLSIAVSDTASNIAGALSTLGSDTHVTSIAVNDSNPIMLAEAAFVADSAGLAKMTGAYTVDVTGVSVAQVGTVEGVALGGTPTLSIAVSDTASAIENAVPTLGADSKVTSIAVSSGTITVTGLGFSIAGIDAGLAKFTGSYSIFASDVAISQLSMVESVTLGGTPTLTILIVDTGANFTSAALVNLGSDSKVVGIIVPSGPITLTEAQYTNSGDQAGLAKMDGTYTVDVTGVTVAQVATVEGQSPGGTPTLSIAVSDTGANLTAPKLITLGADSKVTSIAVTSGAIALTATQFTTAGEEAGLAKMTGAYTVNVTNAGVAAVATVEAVHLGGTPTLSIAVTDIGSRFTSAKLVSFGSDSKVTSITVTSGPIVLTESQFTAPADHAGLAKLIGAYTVDVTGVTVAQVPTVEAVTLPGGTPTLSIAVSDTGVDISSAALTSLGSDSHVTSISVTSGLIRLTETQFTSDSAGLAKMTGAYSINVTGVTVAQVATVEGQSIGGTPTLTIGVNDSGLNITSAALASLGSDSKVVTIAATDSNPITLTESQFVSDGSGLAKLTGTYTVDVTGATVAQLSTVESFNFQGTPTLNIAVADTAANVGNAESALNADTHVTGITVSDSAANISTYIDQLAGLTNLTHVTVNDASILNLTYTQFTTDSHAFSVMSETGYPNFFYNVVGVTVAQGHDVYFNHLNYIGSNGRLENYYVVDTAANIANGDTTIVDSAAANQVSDTAANVSTYLDGLQAIQPHLIGTFTVTLSDPTDNLVVTEAQLTSDHTVLHAITNPSFDVMVTNVAVADIGSIAGDVTTANANGVLTTMTVSDSGANFTDAGLQTIGSNSAVTSATVTSGFIQLTESQFTSGPELAGLAKMTGAYAITVGLVTVAEVTTVEIESLGGTPTLSINVQDTGSNLTRFALNVLGADSKVQHISVSSGTITLTEGQFVSSGVDAGLAKMNGSYTVAVTGVLASQVAAVEAVPLNGSPTLQIALSDSGTSLTAAELTTLGSDTNVTSITTSSPIILTEAQFTNAGVDAGLAKMTGAYTVDVTGVTVAQVSTVESQSGLGGTPTLSLAVTDTGANITAAKLISLGADSKVASISVTSGPITLTTNQYTNAGEDAGLAKMTGAYTVDVINVGVAMVSTVEAVTGLGGTPTLSIAVTDIGSRITSAELVTLGADSKVTSITVTSGPISLTQAQYLASADHAGLAKLTGAYTVDVTAVTVAKVATVEAVTGLGGSATLAISVKDTAANLTPSAFTTLGADSKVASIAVSSGTLTFTEAQYTTTSVDLGLAKMTGSYSISVSGVSVAQLSTVEGVSIGGTPTLSIAVSDTGANFTSAELIALGADSKVASIAVTSGVISLSEAHYLAANDDAGLAKIAGPYTVDVLGATVAQVPTVEAYQPGSITLSIAVSDIGGNITSSALSTLGADSKVASIAATSGAISLTEAQFVSAADDAGLAKMTGAYTVDVTGVTAAQVVTVENQTGLGGTPTVLIAVSDTGANLTSVELVSLGSNANVTAIAVTSGPITLTEAQFTNSNDLAGLAKMVGAYTVDVTGVTVAQLSAVEGVTGLGGTPTLSIAVTDVAANFTSSVLQTIGGATNITSAAVTDGNPIVLAEAQFTSVTTDDGLAKMIGAYTVDVTGATAAQVATVEGVTGLGGTPTLSIAVSDTGAHLTGSVLSALGTDGDVTSIAVSSGAISVTANQITSAGDIAAFAKMVGSYTVDVTAATVAQVAAVEAVTLSGTPTLSIAVSDTGAHITSSALAGFGADNDVTSIAATSGAISLTEAQFTAVADDAGLAKMTGAYTVDITGVTAAQVTAVEAVTGLGGAPTLSISVNDTGGNLTASALNSLGSDPDVTSIAVSSGAITLSEAQFTNTNVDAGLDKLAGSYTVDVTGVGVAQIAAVEGVSLPGAPTLSVAVSDTGAAVSGDFFNLGGDADITSIAATSGVLSLDVSIYAVANDLAALAKMTGSYTIDLTGVSVAQIPLVEGAIYGGTPTLSIAVSDSGLNITDAALQALGADGNVTSIAVNDSNPITLTESQFTGSAEDAGLAKLTGSYTVDVSGVSVAQVSTVEGLSLPGTPTLSIAVSDIGASFTSAALTGLGSDSDIASIAVTSGAISLSESHFVSAGVDAGLNKINGAYTVDVLGVSVAQVAAVESNGNLTTTPTLSIAVSDTGTNINDAALQTLGADNDVTSIAVTSGAIALTAAQYLGAPEDLGLAKMTGHYTVDVSGATVAQVATIEATSVGGTPTLSIAVSDTGSNVTSAALVSLGADGDVASITDSSGPISLTESQFVNANDAAGLGKMIGSYTVDVTGVHVAQVSIVEGLTGLGGTPTLVIGVADTGADITDAALQTLGADNDVSTIQVSSGAISLTESQFTGTPEEAGLAKMTGSYVVDVSGVSVAQVSLVEAVSVGGSPTLSIAVVDVSGSITDAALKSLGADSDVTSISVINGVDSNTLAPLTEAQFTGAAEDAGLAKMTGSPYTVDVTGVSVAQIAAVEAVNLAGTPTLSIAVSDIGADITSAALVSMGSDSDVTSIAVTSGAITLTEAQFITGPDEKGLQKIVGNFTVDVTGATAGQVSAVTTDFSNLTNAANGTLSIAVSDTAVRVANNAPALNTNTNVTSVAVTDTAAHVATDLDILNGVAALNSITLTDATPVLTLTESQFVGGLLALETIQNASFAIDVTNATAAQAGTINSDFTALSNEAQATLSIAVSDNAANVANYFGTFGRVTSVHVTDSEANIDANIDVLEGVHPLTAITITNATAVVSLTAVQVEDDSIALSVITNSAFTVNASGATAAQAASIVSEISGLTDASHITYAIGVSDSAASIAAALNNLENEHVSSLSINDSNPLNITYAQFNADSTVLGKLTGTDTVNVTGVTGHAYGSFTDTYINGVVAETVENNTDGSTTVIGFANSLTYTPGGPSAHVESITVTGTHSDSFDFSGTFGNVSITGFSLANDAIQFSSAEFANVAAVELHTTSVGGNAVVTLDSGDTITMVGVSVNSFEAHSTDWTFV